MKRTAYRQLGLELNAIMSRLDPLDMGEDEMQAESVREVIDLLADFFRSNDPDFDDGAFLAATNGA